jgi:hypothetical protein
MGHSVTMPPASNRIAPIKQSSPCTTYTFSHVSCTFGNTAIDAGCTRSEIEERRQQSTAVNEHHWQAPLLLSDTAVHTLHVFCIMPGAQQNRCMNTVLNFLMHVSNSSYLSSNLCSCKRINRTSQIRSRPDITNTVTVTWFRICLNTP